MSMNTTFNHLRNKKNFPLMPMAIPLALYLGSIIFLYILPFSAQVGIDIVVISVVDYILTLFVVGVFIVVNKYRIVKINLSFKTHYQSFMKKYYCIFSLFVLYSLYATYKNMSMVLLDGYNREGLLNEVSAGYLDMLLPSLFSCLFVVSVIYKYPFKVKILLFTGVISVMLFYLSRSNLLFLIFFPFIFLYVLPHKLNNKKILKLLLIMIIIVIMASYITILQGRGDNLKDVIFKITETLFRYKAYSFYLAEYAIQVSHGAEKSVFPFLGWLSEKIISLYWVVSEPISVYGSTFVSDFRLLGNGYKANVLYPWWAWFYGYYGVLGLFIKALYIYIILSIVLRFKMCLTFMFLLYIILFSIVVKHPLINAGAFYAFVSLIVFDLLVKVKYGTCSK
jgi:hypothetical protein